MTVKKAEGGLADSKNRPTYFNKLAVFDRLIFGFHRSLIRAAVVKVSLRGLSTFKHCRALRIIGLLRGKEAVRGREKSLRA